MATSYLVAVLHCALSCCAVSSYEVRLIPPTNEPTANYKGTVLVRTDSKSPWGTICDDIWGVKEANVVCRMLGFPEVISFHNQSSLGVQALHAIVLDDVSCTGTETNLASCKSRRWGEHNCGESEQVGVTCGGIEVKLRPPSNEPAATNKGTVLVRYNSTSSWGTICRNSWDINDAKVVCRVLGFPFAIRTSIFETVAGYPIILDNVNCSGLEWNIHDCKRNPYGINNCRESDQAGVICGGNFEVRIEPIDLKTRHTGTVLVRYNSASPWGTICDTNWDIRDANVVCRMLGFPAASQVHSHSKFGQFDVLPFLLEDISCNGEETILENCPSYKFGSSRCAKLPNYPQGGNAGVTCVMPEYQVRLEAPANEKSNHRGTVLVRYNSTSSWGTICDDYWDMNDANVICRMLGFRKATAAHSGSQFGVHEGYPIVLDDVECIGNETNLANCWSWRGFGSHNCHNRKQSGVTCYKELCTVKSCSGHGTCFPREDGTTACVCDHGFTSNNCSKDAYVMRRLDIIATYNVSCHLLHTASSIIQSVIDCRFHDMEQIFSRIATRSMNQTTSMECANDTLKVTWPTSLTYTAGVTSIPHDVYSNMTSRLAGKQNLLDLFLPANKPPVLRPHTTKSGLIADLVLTSYCRNKKIFSSANDSCIDRQTNCL